MNTCQTCNLPIRRDGRTVTGWRHDDPDASRNHWPMPTYVQCPATADLVVDGRPTGALLRCDLSVLPDDEGHEHRCTLVWADDESIAESWPERYDADEGFDLEVDIAPRDAINAQRAVTDPLAVVTSIDDE